MARYQRHAARLVSTVVAVVLVGTAAPTAWADDSPVILGVAPTVVAAGGTATISGTGLTAGAGSPEVLVNGVAAMVAAATSTSLSVVVPSTATSGPVTVRTGAGEAQSGTDLFVPPPAVPVAQVLHTSRLTPATPTTVELPTADGVGLLTVPLAAGDRFALRLSGGTFGTSTSTARISVTRPDGSALLGATGFANAGLFVDPLTAPVAGTYTVLVDPQGTATGKVTVESFVVPPDLSEPTTPGAGPVLLRVATPGQNAAVTFTGSAGQRVALSLSGSTLPTATATALRLNRSDGAALVSTSFSAATAFVDAVTLPATGTYTVVVNPGGASTGEVSVDVLDATTLVTDALPDGELRTATTTVAGQNAALALPLEAGRRVSVQVVDSTFGTSSSAVRLSLVGPTGTAVIGATNAPKGAFLEPVTVPVTGVYQLGVDPSGQATGSLSVRVFTVPADVGATTAAGGPAIALEVTTPGQNGTATFDGVAGQRVAVEITGATFTGSSTLRLNRPDGSALLTTSMSGSTAFIDATTLPAAGAYGVSVNPAGAATGSVQVRVVDASDAVTEVGADGALVVTTTTAGQNGSLRVPLRAGDRLAVQVVDQTYGTSSSSVRLSVLTPAGAVLVPATNAPKGAFLEPVVAPVDGTYQVQVDPSGQLTGLISVRLHTVPADVVTSTAAGAEPVPVTIATPGQNAAVAFAGIAGQRVAVNLTGSSFPVTAATGLRLNRPDGTTLVSTSWTTASAFVDAVTLPVDGTYTITINPAAAATGAVAVAVLDATPSVTDVGPDGSLVTVATTVPGQNAALRVGLTAGQRVAVQVVGQTFGSSSALRLSLVGPAGATVVAPANAPSGTFVEPVPVSADGQYQVVLDPSAMLTGTASLRVFAVPTDVTVEAEIGGEPVAVTVGTPGQNGAATFHGTAGQRVALDLRGSTFSTSTATALRLNKPDGNALVSMSFSAASAYVDAVTLPVDGLYTVVVNPAGAVTGSVDVTVFDSAVPVTDVAPDGSLLTTATTVAGQNAALRFPLAAGDRVAVEVVDQSFGASSALKLSVVSPTGTALIPATNGPRGTFLEPVTATTSGLHQLVLDPSGTLTGTASVRIHTVPADESTATDPGAGPVLVEAGTPGQNASLTFTGSAGQRVALSLTGSTFAGSTGLRLNRPDGTALVSTSFTGTSTFVDTVTLPVGGTWTVALNPSGASTGAVSVELVDASTPATDVDADGSLVEASTSVPGQSAALRFPMAAGGRVAVQVVDSTYGTSSSAVRLSVVGLDGGTVIAPTNAPRGTFLEPAAVPADGSYQLVVDPSGQLIGKVTVRVFTVPPDATSTTTVGGDPVALVTSTPGQNAAVTFTGVAGQRVALSVSGSTFATTTSTALRVNRPDGTALVSSSYAAATAFVDSVALPVDGTYTVLVNPGGVATGSAAVQVLDATTEVVETVADGRLVTATTTVPGQNAVLRVPLNAGDRVAVHVVTHSYGTVSSALRTSVVGPTGAPVIAASGTPTGTLLEPAVVMTGGLHEVVLDPGATATGTASVRVFTVPADVVIETAPGEAPVALTVTTPGQNAQVVFAGVAGQRVAVAVTGSTFAGSTAMRVARPDGTAVASSSYAGATAFQDAVTLPVDGIYTVVLNPAGAATGSASVQVLDADVVIEDVRADGSLVEARATVPGQNVALRFPLEAGERFAVQVVDTTFGTPSSSARISVTGPDGATVTPATNAPRGTFLEPVAATSAGDHRLLVDPSGQLTGTLTVRVFTVPADTLATTAVGGAAVALSTTTPGQNAALTFTGAAGELVSLSVSSSTFSSSTSTGLRLVNPDGTALVSTSFSAANAFVDAVRLPADGTYTVAVNPAGVTTGSALVQVIDATTRVVEAAADGGVLRVGTQVPGQNAVVRFPLRADDRFSIVISESTYGTTTNAVRVGLRAPSGAWVLPLGRVGIGTYFDARSAPEDGVYELVVDPGSDLTGDLALAIHGFADAATPTEIGGPPVTLTVDHPGQTAAATFSGTAGRRVVALLDDATVSGELRLVSADGEELASSAYSGDLGYLDAVVLPADTTYSVVLDPVDAYTGSARVRVLEAPADLTGAITVDGVPAHGAFTGPGQDVRLSTALVAGTTYGLNITLPPTGATLTVAAADGSWTRSTNHAGDSLDWVFSVPSSGPAVVTVDPEDGITGAWSADLYSVVSTPRVAVDGMSAEGWLRSTSVEATWSVSHTGHPIAGYAVLLDRSPATDPGTATTQTRSSIAADLDEGGHWLHVRAVTTAGYAGPVVHRMIGVDITPPRLDGLTSTTHPDPEVLSAEPGVEVSWTEPEDDTSGVAGYSVEVSRSRVPDVDETVDQTATHLRADATEDGEWSVHVRPVDRAGNVGEVVSLSASVDPSAPAAPVVTTDRGAGSSSQRTLVADLAPGDGGRVDAWAVVRDREPGTVPDGSVSTRETRYVEVVPPGTSWVHVRAQDALGRWGETTHVQVDVAEAGARVAVPTGRTMWDMTSIAVDCAAGPDGLALAAVPESGDVAVVGPLVAGGAPGACAAPWDVLQETGTGRAWPDGEYALVVLDAAGAEVTERVAVSVATGLDPAERIERDYAVGLLTAEERARLLVDAVLAPGSIPDRYRDTTGEAPTSAAVIEAWAALDDDARAVLTGELSVVEEPGASARRVSGDCGNSYRSYGGRLDCKATTAHFAVYYRSGSVGPTPSGATRAAWVTRMLDALEHAYTTYDDLGFRVPGHRLDVVLDPLMAPGVGMSLPSFGPGTRPVIYMDSSPTQVDEYLPQHELFHQVQYQYISASDVITPSVSPYWFMEASAEWAANVVQIRPDAPGLSSRTYARELQTFLDRSPDTFTHSDPWSGGAEYGAFVLAEFLEEEYGAEAAIEEMWERIGSGFFVSSPVAAMTELMNEHGDSYAEGIERFRLWTYVFARRGGIGFTDPQAKPGAAWRWGVGQDDQYRPPHVTLDLDAANPLDDHVTLAGGGASFVELDLAGTSPGTVTVEIDASSVASVSAFTSDGYPDVCSAVHRAESSGDLARLTIPVGQDCRRVVLALVDLDVPSASRHSVRWSASFAPTGAILSNGTIDLGLTPDGSLIADGTGIRRTGNGASEALALGCACEGWGISDGLGDGGHAYTTESTEGLARSAFDLDGDDEMTISHTVGRTLEVTHHFHPSSEPDLYQVDVTVRRTSFDFPTASVHYRRSVDFDMAPTEFDEYVSWVKAPGGGRRLRPLPEQRWVRDPGHVACADEHRERGLCRTVRAEGPGRHDRSRPGGGGSAEPGHVHSLLRAQSQSCRSGERRRRGGSGCVPAGGAQRRRDVDHPDRSLRRGRRVAPPGRRARRAARSRPEVVGEQPPGDCCRPGRSRWVSASPARVWAAGVSCSLALGALGGCIVDRQPPTSVVANETDQPVDVEILGPDGSRVGSFTLGPTSAERLPLEECLGDAMVVSTEDGVELGRIDEPLCAGAELVVGADGTVTFGDL